MIKIYCSPKDPYAARLKSFLNIKRIQYEEKPAEEADPSWKLPQLVIRGKPIGDYEEVTSLDLKGEFDDMLL